MKAYNVIEYTEGPGAEHTELARDTVTAENAADALRLNYPAWSKQFPITSEGPDRAICEGTHAYARVSDMRYFIEAEPADPEDLAHGPLNLTKQEFAAVLVGLRMLQRDVERYGPGAMSTAWDHFIGESVLCPSTKQIDVLCERLNCGPDPLPANIGDIVAGLLALSDELDDSNPGSSLNRAIELLGTLNSGGTGHAE